MARQLEIKQPFDLELSLTMGQAFRWRRLPADCATDGNGWFSGVIGDNLIHIRQIDAGVEYRVGGPDGERDADLGELLSAYFRLDDDVEAIYADLSARDSHMAMLIRQYSGMRVLRQEPWECLVSYICSKSNRIPGICQCVAEIANLSRQPVKLDDDKRHIFPTPQQVVAAGAEVLANLDLKGRFSSDFPSAICAVAQRICDEELNLDYLRKRPYSEVVRILMQGSRYKNKANGIGPKIADCVALMALDKTEAFPVDTHIREVVRDRYFRRQKLPSDKKIVQWAQNKFGKYAGYAGQYMFYAQRTKADGPAPCGTTSSGAALRLIGDATDSSRSASSHPRYPNRNYPCPKCRADAGMVCHSPSGYRYEKGHSERGS